VGAPLRRWPRFWQVLVVLTRAFVLPALPFRRRTAPGGPVRARAALEQLGGAWVKLGQMLAMRFDLLPAPYGEELFELRNQVEPFPYAQVGEMVRRELGAAPEAVFRAFTPEPFAAASTGQVHRAVLPTGERVAAPKRTEPEGGNERQPLPHGVMIAHGTSGYSDVLFAPHTCGEPAGRDGSPPSAARVSRLWVPAAGGQRVTAECWGRGPPWPAAGGRVDTGPAAALRSASLPHARRPGQADTDRLRAA